MCKLTIILVDPMKMLLLTFCNSLSCVIFLKTKNIIFSRHSALQRRSQISTSIIWIIWNFFAIYLTCPLLPSPTALTQCYNTAAFFLKSILHLIPLHFSTIVFIQVNFYFVILVCCNSCLFYYWNSIFFFHRRLIKYIFCSNIAS